jgi:uncharacterized protein (TIGR00369 family)
LDRKLHYSNSPFLEHLGLALEEWRDGYIRIGLLLKPFHLNRSGVVHGGVLATLLDHSVTLSLTSNYLSQSRAGKIIAVGERVRAGGKVFFSRSEVLTDAGVVLAAGTGVYRYRSGSEGSEGVPLRQPVEERDNS